MHTSLLSPQPLCFSKMPCSHSLFLNTSLHFKSANLHHWFSPVLIPTTSGCFPVLLSEFLLIIQIFFPPHSKRRNKFTKEKVEISSRSHHLLFFFPPKWPYPHSIHICPHSLTHLRLIPFSPIPTTIWMIIFPPHPSLRPCSSSLLPGDRLDLWCGQMLPRDAPETEAMHGSSITFHPPSPPCSPTPTPNCSSFMHAPVSFHSCSFSLLYRSPPLRPHFLAFSRSFITEGIYHPPVHLQPHNAFSATKHLTTHIYKICKKKRLPCVSFQKEHG